MKRRPKQIRTKLLDLVKEMSEHPDKYISYPGKDFTRKRKLPFEKMIGTLLGLIVINNALFQDGYDTIYMKIQFS